MEKRVVAVLGILIILLAGFVAAERETQQVREQEREYSNGLGEQFRVRFESGRVQLETGDVSADSDVDLEVEDDESGSGSTIRARLSNGRYSEVKVMPDTASETALERLRLRVCNAERNCTIELREVGDGDQVRMAYEVRAEKQAKVLGLFKTRMEVQAQVDAETGEVIQTRRPWWSFLASEEDD